MDGKYVFISYKAEEYDKVKPIKDHLEANGIPCWMAPMSIRGGMSYAQEIPPAIQNSGVFLLMLSEKAQASKWVPREVDQAINCSKLVMPYMMEDFPLRSDFSFYLTNVQRYEAFRDPEETLARMTRDIQNALGIVLPVKEEIVTEAVVVEIPKTPSKPKKEKKPKSTNKKPLRWILCGLLLAVLLVTLLLPGKNSGSFISRLFSVTIGGVDFEKDAFSVTLENVTLTQEDVNKFSSFEKLYIIQLTDCVLEAQDLSPMATTSLTTLELTNCQLTDAQFSTIDFTAIPYFSKLFVDGNPDLTNLDGLSVCANVLTELDISDTGIRSYDWIPSFTKLKTLRADRIGLQDTSLLEGLIYLEKLSLSGNGISSLDGLKNTSKLTEVDLSHNDLADVSVLGRSATSLTVLHLENNAISDLSCLSGTENLKKVYVDENELQNLDWLKNNQKLQILTASHNQIDSISQLGIGAKMRYLNLSHNALTSISAEDFVFGDSNYLVVDLCNNQLQTLHLPSNCTYKKLALLGNPDLDISTINTLKGQNVYLDFPTGVSLQTLKDIPFNSLCIVGCPLDRQVEIEEGLSGEHLLTQEEALDEIARAEQAEDY